MPSERIQRQIERFLDEAEEAAARSDWEAVNDRAQNVLALDPENSDALTYLSAAERRLDQAASSPPDHGIATPAPTLTPEPSPSRPTSFANGRYKAKSFLGEGGKKQVFHADDNLLDRDVAFALIKIEGLDDVGRQRIRREAQIMGRLGSHPNIVSVLDFGEEPILGAGPVPLDGPTPTQPYLVTELMAGGDVEGLIAKAPDHKMPLERTLQIALEVSRGLVYAHSKEVIHRDIKPGNVWLTQDGVAKIGDFGLAFVIDRSRLTQVGMMVGTVSYMPPEQGMGGEATKRSDLYSLGAMLYEMVTGRPPFVGDENIAIISQHINTPPISPSWHRPDLPPALEGLILRLLEKDPGKRPATASEVLRALESIDLSPRHTDVGAIRESPLQQPSATDSPIYRRAFVGREAELKGLHTAFDNAMSGNGSMMMVVGEPGIGKTALCEQIATFATLRGGRALVGHSYEEGSMSLPYLPFVEAMRTYVLDRPPEALKEELGTGAMEVARIVSEIRERAQVEPRQSGDPEDDRWRLLQAVTTFLRNAAATQPIMLVIEDLHWADKGTLDLLVHLARNLSGSRLLVVGTYRDMEVDRAHPLSPALAELRRVGELPRVLLRGLTVDEVHRMLNTLAGGQEVSWALAEAVHRQTEGNPLFIQEVLRYIVEAGMVTREGGHWRTTGDTPLEMSIPEGLRDVIGKRLSRLSQECNRLLSIAAVIGRDFRLDTLQAVAGASENEIVSGLEEAVKVGVLEDQSKAGSVRFRFTHAFFRQTLYEEMFTPRRLRLHQGVARVLEGQYGSRLEEHAAELAEHFAQSSDPEDLTKAVEYSEMAAKRAMSVYAYGEAARLLEQSLQAQEVVDPSTGSGRGPEGRLKRCDLLLALGEALMPAGEPQRVYKEVAEEAFTLAEAIGDNTRMSHACHAALQALTRYGATLMLGTPEYRQWAERTDRAAPADTIERVNANIALADLRTAEGKTVEAWSLRNSALTLARRLADPDATFAVFNSMITYLNNGPQHQEERHRLADEIATRSREGVSPRTLGQLLTTVGHSYLERGDRQRAEDMWRQVQDLASRTRDANLVLTPQREKVALLTMDGRLDEAVETIPRIISEGEELGIAVRGRQIAATSGLRPLFYLGRAEDALTHSSQPSKLAGAPESHAITARRALCMAHIGRYTVSEGDSAEGQTPMASPWREAQIILNNMLEPWTGASGEIVDGDWTSLCQLLEIAVLVTDKKAIGLLTRLFADFSHLLVGAPEAPTPVARHLGAAAALLGEREKAKVYYHQALEVCAKVRHRPETAITRLQLAELLLQEAEEIRRSQGRGDLAPTGEAQDVGVGSSDPTVSRLRRAEDIRKEAIGHLDFAISEFQEMKMQPYLERALRHKGILKA